MMKLLKTIGILLFTLSLSGCGFALREPPDFTPRLQNMYISTSVANANSPFMQTLIQMLDANNINLVDNPKEATSTLNILSVQTTNTMASGGGVNVSGFYSAYLIVQFSVTDAQGHYLIAPTSLQQSQNFTSNATQVLSSSLTAAQLTNQMNQLIAQGIINQLAKAKPAPNEAQS